MNKKTFPNSIPTKQQYMESTKNHEADIESDYPPFLYFLFLFFSLYLVIPLIDIPLLGLSLSAPIFFLVAIPVLLRPARRWFGTYGSWILIATLIWLGIFFSAILNGLFSGGTRVDLDSLISLIQFAYWLLTFVVTAYLLSSQNKLFERLLVILATGIAILGALRLGEAVFGGAIGAWTSLQFMSQNSYGLQFSMFYPVLLSFIFWGTKRKMAALATLTLLAAILINGSRTGWLTTLVSTITFLWMYVRTQRHYARAIFILLFLGGMLGIGILFAPRIIISSFEQRLSTFQRLEQDKSYAIRQLMIQKGLRIFQSSPFIGIGVSRWRKETIALELPTILGYAPQSYFDTKSSHNSYVSFLAENGLVGAIPLALLLLILTIKGYKSAKNLSKQGHIWALGIYASFIGMSIHLWALSGLTGTSTWFIYGLMAAIIKLDQLSTVDKATTTSYAPGLSLPRSRRF